MERKTARRKRPKLRREPNACANRKSMFFIAKTAWIALERDDFSSNRHPALAFCWSMIFSENRHPLFGIML
jgi:hypothetical protein